MEPFIFIALLLALLGLHVVLSLLSSALGIIYDTLDSLFYSQVRGSRSNTSGFGSHDKDKEQELWISSIGQLQGLDMFELNRLKFEQSLEHRLPEFNTSEFAHTCIHEGTPQSYTISIFDQIFVITCKQMEGLQMIQELLNEISTTAPNLNIRMCSSGLVPGPQTGVLGAVANIRNQLRLAVSRQNNAITLQI